MSLQRTFAICLSHAENFWCEACTSSFIGSVIVSITSATDLCPEQSVALEIKSRPHSPQGIGRNDAPPDPAARWLRAKRPFVVGGLTLFRQSPDRIRAAAARQFLPLRGLLLVEMPRSTSGGAELGPPEVPGCFGRSLPRSSSPAVARPYARPAQPDLGGVPFGVGVLRLACVVFQRNRLIANVFDLVDLMRGINCAAHGIVANKTCGHGAGSSASRGAMTEDSGADRCDISEQLLVSFEQPRDLGHAVQDRRKMIPGRRNPSRAEMAASSWCARDRTRCGERGHGRGAGHRS